MRVLWEVQDVARRVNLSADSIRQHERLGRLPAFARTPRGLRLFDPETVESFAAERAAKKANGPNVEAFRVPRPSGSQLTR